MPYPQQQPPHPQARQPYPPQQPYPQGQRPPQYPPQRFGAPQQFGRPPQFGPPPFQQQWPMYPPPRKKSNAGPILAVVMVAVLVGAAVVFGVIQQRKSNSPVLADPDPGYSAPTETTTKRATSSRTTTATTESETTTDTTTEATPTTTESGGRPQRPTTTTVRTTTAAPQTNTRPPEPAPVYRLGDNPIFSTTNGVNAVTCNLPAWRSDPQAAQSYFTAALPCLEQAWTPALARANLPYKRPGLKFPAGTSWTSPCGSVTGATAAAFYCSRDNTLYMPFAGLATERVGNKTGSYLSVFAHEFAHHIQWMTGIMQTYGQARYEAGDQSPKGLELSRRLELMGQCFSGMWFAGAQHGGGSITDTVIREMIADGYTRSDASHGTAQHYGAWQEQGFTTNRTYQCNTWVIAAEHVA
ncbi:neutral zinc metallopeptidase [Actinokineospora sp. HUAS TT18]|uniref:neutral zinc metallopeptidase n=1 Tax=Actinokineospora sp. HUAS TT18 TaxID=3447451 RepID=UPI003F524926